MMSPMRLGGRALVDVGSSTKKPRMADTHIGLIGTHRIDPVVLQAPSIEPTDNFTPNVAGWGHRPPVVTPWPDRLPLRARRQLRHRLRQRCYRASLGRRAIRE